MITGAGNLTGIFADRNQINLINNFLIIVITVIFYWFYSENVLERRGLIVKKHFYPEDVVLVLRDFKQTLVSRDALNTSKFGDEDLEDYLRIHNLSVPELTPSIEPEPEPEPERESEFEPYRSDDDDTQSWRQGY